MDMERRLQIHQVYQLHQLGIQQLQCADYSNAIVSFQEALKHHLACGESFSSIQINDPKLHQSGPIIKRIPLSEATPTFETTLHNDIFVLFHSPLDIAEEALKLVGETCFHDNLLSAVLLYNYGLAHHLLGLQKGERLLLTTALSFYAAAYTSFSQAKRAWRDNPLYLLSMGFLALVNNMGHIHAYFRSFPQAVVCSDELTMHLFHVSSSPYFKEFEGDFETFFMNISFSRETQLTAAPAA